MGARFSLLLLIDVAGITSKREGFVMTHSHQWLLVCRGALGIMLAPSIESEMIGFNLTPTKTTREKMHEI